MRNFKKYRSVFPGCSRNRSFKTGNVEMMFTVNHTTHLSSCGDLLLLFCHDKDYYTLYTHLCPSRGIPSFSMSKFCAVICMYTCNSRLINWQHYLNGSHVYIIYAAHAWWYSRWKWMASMVQLLPINYRISTRKTLIQREIIAYYIYCKYNIVLPTT